MLLSLLTHLNHLTLNADDLAIRFGIDVSSLGWLCEFLAEPANAQIQEFLHQFWEIVIQDATLSLKEYDGRGNKRKGDAESFEKG